MEQARPQGPLEPLKLNLWKSNVPEETPKCQEAFLSCKGFYRDPCTYKHFPRAVAWGVQLRGGFQAASLPGGLAGPWEAETVGEQLLYS